MPSYPVINGVERMTEMGSAGTLPATFLFVPEVGDRFGRVSTFLAAQDDRFGSAFTLVGCGTITTSISTRTKFSANSLIGGKGG